MLGGHASFPPLKGSGVSCVFPNHALSRWRATLKRQAVAGYDGFSMKRTIFYSWQADLPNRTNRGFIQRALKDAAGLIASELAIEPVIERDTQGVAGSPDIVKTIFAKISTSDVFVADVTPVATAASG